MRIEFCSSRHKMVVACLAVLMATTGVSCTPAPSRAPELHFDLAASPSPPTVGDCHISLTVTDPGGSPVRGARVSLEGNMNHAGMKPSFAELQEVESGRYEGTLEFTMGGDWFILATAHTADGKTIERKFDMPGVKAE